MCRGRPCWEPAGTLASPEAGWEAGDDAARRELCFFLRNSALRLEFLLFVEGLTFFLVRASGKGAEALISLVSREKEKVESILREKVKALPWLANVWQKAKHWDPKEDSSPCSVAAVIFTSSSELKKSVEEHRMEHVAAFTLVNHILGIKGL